MSSFHIFEQQRELEVALETFLYVQITLLIDILWT